MLGGLYKIVEVWAMDVRCLQDEVLDEILRKVSLSLHLKPILKAMQKVGIAVVVSSPAPSSLNHGYRNAEGPGFC